MKKVIICLSIILIFVGCKPRVDPVLKKGYTLYSKGKYKEALTVYDQFIIKNKDNVNGYLLRAELYLKINQLDKSMKDYIKILTLDKKNVYAFHQIGIIYHNKKNYKKAIEYFEQNIAHDPHSFLGYYNMACAYSLLKNKEKSLWAYEHAVNIYNTMDVNRKQVMNHNMYKYSLADDDLKFIRNDKRFRVLLHMIQ